MSNFSSFCMTGRRCCAAQCGSCCPPIILPPPASFEQDNVPRPPMFDFLAWSNDPGEAIFPLHFFGSGLIMSFLNISHTTQASALVLAMTNSAFAARGNAAVPAAAPGDPYYIYIGVYDPSGNLLVKTVNGLNLVDHVGFNTIPLEESVTLEPGVYRLVMIFAMPGIPTADFAENAKLSLTEGPLALAIPAVPRIPAWNLYLSVSLSSIYGMVQPPMAGIGELYPEMPLPPGAVLPPTLDYVEIFSPEPFFWCALA